MNMNWPLDATLTLIRRRRHYQLTFTTTRQNQQRQTWRTISQEINNLHPNFNPTTDQTRSKWNALVQGFKNLERLLNDNRDYPLYRPTLHDEYFHEELSDQFWLVECN